MPWFDRIIPESIKKNVCAYLLQRYLGQFFEEKLTRDQLSVDLYNGTGTVEKISLDVQALNELSEKQNWPMEFVDGFIETLHVRIPWSAILKDPSFVEVRGLKVTVQPKQRTESATSMFESMWNSMTSSMQLAEECAKQDAANLANNAQTYEGIEMFAQTIDSILSRVQVKFVDTVVQIEHVPKDSSTGVGITINIDVINYTDEAGSDPENPEDLTNQDSNKAYIVQSFTTKKLLIQGVTLSTVEFGSKGRTFSRSVINQSEYYEKEKDDSLTALISVQSDDEDENFYATKPERRDSQYGNEEKTGTETELSDNRQVIMFGKISGKQEIRIRLKQSENVNGPKVSIELNLGSLTAFLSPRQFHVLVELANGLSSPDMEDSSNVAPRARCIAKPMSPLDYHRVEQELQQQLHPLSNFQMTGLQGTHGWSTAALDESDTDDNFLPMKTTVSGMYDSTLSGVSSSMESSVSSSMNSSVTENTFRNRRRLNNIDSDPTAEISHFQIRIASLALILLHEDLLVQQQDYSLAPSSVKQMQQTVDDFFQNVGPFILTAYGNKDFENARDVFEKACSLNHLRLLAAPVQIEGDEKTTLTAFSISGHLTAAKLELLECIYHLNDKTEYVPLLVFNDLKQETLSNPITAKPSFKLSFKHVERTSKNMSRRNIGPKTDITITLNECDVEFDITIIDRITALLHPEPICIIEKNHFNPWNTNAQNKPAHIGMSPVESKIDLRFISSLINLRLRFPIPDFRPAHDMNRVPWWKRHVRPDYLSLVFSDCTLLTSFLTKQTHQEYSIECRALDVFYYEAENSVPVEIGKAGFDANAMQDAELQTRLNLKFFPPKKTDVDDAIEADLDPMTHSVYGAFENQGFKLPGPFSAKRVVHESDTPHSKPHKDDSEELIMPGDKYEMEDFVSSTSASTQIQVDVSFPALSLQLQSKHIYELIYNRINNDLLLWEASAPKPKAKTFYENVNLNVEGGQEIFSMCKSGIQYESESDSDEDSDQGANVFYSTYDKGMKLSQKQQPANSSGINKSQSDFVMEIKIAHGLVSLFTPVRDDSSNNVIPSQQGEFLLNVEDAKVFIVSGYKGDDNLGFVCVQVHKADLNHCEMMTVPSTTPPIRGIGGAIERHLNSTIYKSESGMTDGTNKRGGDREMFTVAVRIQANHETHHVKTVRVALGLNKATLRHRMCTSSNTWISHLLDFFNVQDYPIPGYHAKDVLTELHLHLWDCAIDYRPLYLPFRSALCLGNFSMSSHLSAQANSSTLRFIAEECGLYLSDVGKPRNGVASMAPVDLKRDYVNVIDVGLFELSLKINDKKSGINPHIDLRASNNIINIHTCSDSGRALMQLITYFANDGDLLPEENLIKESSSYSSPKVQDEPELIPVEAQDISSLSISQHQHVNDLLGEAMRENEQPEESVDILQNAGARLFFFPDENQIAVAQDALAKPLPQVTCELGDVTIASNRSSDTDDDFCFVGNEAGLGTITNNGLPDIKWLTNDAVRLIDNHFTIPVGKTDLLKPPKHYPTPVLRYTLCEMSIIWHMYGGNDFKEAEKVNQKKTVNFSDTQLNDVVSFSKSQKDQVTFQSLTDKKKNNMSWIVRGGVNRDHSVLIEFQLNKIRFQHDVYPETTKHASRQVLIVSDLEIRDRLESSLINKFLYQYTSQARPKQSHAHMIVIKANHIRPDPKLNTQECCLKVSILPLRFNIDQDSLMFLIGFFGELGGDNSVRDSETVSSKHNTPTHQPPVMTVNEQNEILIKEQAQTMVDENLLILLEESKNIQESNEVPVPISKATVDTLPIYFRSVIFSPEVPIRLDYTGKRVDMTHGSLPGLLMGLAQLNCSELKLKRIYHRHGLLGFDKLVSFLLHEWLNDIKKNQLPTLLGGVGPIHSFVQLFQGIRDLFWLPIEQYQKDGRIVRGLQRGANSFTTSTAMAALELTSRIIHLIQITAETAYDMLSPGPSLKRIAKSKGKKKRFHQPQDIREGMANAYALVKEGLGETADNIVQVASQEREQKGYSGAVGGVLRQIPPTIFKPIIIASEATSNVLGGMRSQLVPDARREANEKWRNSEE